MLLTKKNIAKIAFMVILYFLLGSFSFASGIYFYSLGVHGKEFFIIGAVVYALCPLVALWGRYAEGTAKMLNRYNKLVGQQLKPAEFIREYEDLKASPELVVCKPGYNLLGCLCAVYECLNEHERALEIADEAISVAGKKKSRAMLLKVSLLFSCGKTEEAESLFDEVKQMKLDLISQGIVDIIRKGDRAMAIGDYKTVVDFNLVRLEQKFPKLNNLGNLALRYTLAEAYEKLGETENALTYYRYCAEHGGETAIKTTAQMALERLQ